MEEKRKMKRSLNDRERGEREMRCESGQNGRSTVGDDEKGLATLGIQFKIV